MYGETPHVRGKIHVIQTSTEDQGIDMTLVSKQTRFRYGHKRHGAN